MVQGISPDFDITSIKRKLYDFYKNSQEYLNDLLNNQDENYFKRYISFIKKYVPSEADILDLGCGTGLSSYLLNLNGYNVTGLDISSLFFKETLKWKSKNLNFIVADALNLPFKNNCFDVVSSYLFIEHIIDVERALLEMARVLKSNGLVIILSPNLCSPFTPFFDFINLCLGKKGRPVWSETKFQTLGWFVKNIYISMKKRLSTYPNFIYRVPDLSCKKVVGRDSDAVYLANQMDIRYFLKEHGFNIITSGHNKDMLQQFSPNFAASIDTVARKIKD